MSYLSDGRGVSKHRSRVEIQGLAIGRKAKGSVFAAAAALSLGFVSSAGVARAEEKMANLPALYRSVADAVVSISAKVTHPAHSNLNPATAPQGSTLEEMLSAHFRDSAQQAKTKSADDSGTLGSGFVIDARGIIVTAEHVIGDADDIEVIFSDGRMLRATIVGSDREIDIAVLQVNSLTPLQTVKFGDSDAVSVGEAVIAVGNPFGIGETVTAGIISARHRNLPGKPYDSFLQTDAAMNKGNSGGPLFNMAGEVIGINTAIFSPSGNSIGLGFATPAATASRVITQLENFHETRRGWFGANLQDLNPSLADSMGLESAKGALLSGIDQKGPAALAGFELGDVVVTLGGVSVADAQDMRAQLEPMPDGKRLDVSIMREGRQLSLNIVLGRKVDGAEAVPAATGDAAPELAKEVSAFERNFGLKLSTNSAGAQAYFQLREGLEGVVVFEVIANSSGARTGFQAGDVIEQISRQKVTLPSEVRGAIEVLRQAKRRFALLLVSNPAGVTRFVAMPVT